MRITGCGPDSFPRCSLRLAQDENATVVPSQAVQTGTRAEISSTS